MAGARRRRRRLDTPGRRRSIKEVAEYLGHTDPGFTLRTYTHLVPSSHARARQAVDAVLGAGADTSDGLRTA